MNHLDDVPSIDVLDAAFYNVRVPLRGEVGLDWRRAVETGYPALQLGRQSEGLGQPPDHLIDAGHGIGVGFFHAVVEAGVADHLDVVAQVVEDKHRFREHEDRFGHALGVGGHGRHPRLEVPDGVVGQVADGPAVEDGQAADRDELVLAHLLFYQRQGVHLALGLARAGMEHTVGVGADEAVAAQPLPAFDAFQQEGVRRPGYLEVGRDRSFQVGVDGAVDRHQVALARQGFDLFQSWVVHAATLACRLVSP